MVIDFRKNLPLLNLGLPDKPLDLSVEEASCIHRVIILYKSCFDEIRPIKSMVGAIDYDNELYS